MGFFLFWCGHFRWGGGFVTVAARFAFGGDVRYTYIYFVQGRRLAGRGLSRCVWVVVGAVTGRVDQEGRVHVRKYQRCAGIDFIYFNTAPT